MRIVMCRKPCHLPPQTPFPLLPQDAAEETLDKLEAAGIGFNVLGGGRIQVMVSSKSAQPVLHSY